MDLEDSWLNGSSRKRIAPSRRTRRHEVVAGFLAIGGISVFVAYLVAAVWL